MKPLVSIICITYNQAKYLSSCLDSIFSQQVDFQVELIIHDDASTDSTTEIISQYIKKCPFQIKTILQKENQYSKGIDIFQNIYILRSKVNILLFVKEMIIGRILGNYLFKLKC